MTNPKDLCPGRGQDADHDEEECPGSEVVL
jgi:hypothetical protein